MDKKRKTIVVTIIIFSFCAIFLRLADLMILNHRRFLEKAEMQHAKAENIRVKRGIIFDRCGREMALNVECESLYCDPQRVELDSLKRLASVISEKPDSILAKIPAEGRFAWIKRKLDTATVESVKALNIEGVGFVDETKRFYPEGRLASHILGFVDVDNKPLGGIELQYDEYLKTEGGKVYVGRDAAGRRLSSGVDIEAEGNNIVLTIDKGLQGIVEKEIEKAVLQWNAASATAIVMEPFTGEILALANTPTYDPNKPGEASDFERRNRAITDCYEPGSTFKIVVGIGALEEKLVKPDTMFDVSKGSIEVGGKTIRDIRRHKTLTFKEVIQKSSNVGTIMIGMKLGPERLYKYAKLLGFGEKTGIDLPGEASGWIRPPKKWSATSIGAISIGHEVAVTPLQILRAYSALANGGFLVRPHVVSAIISPDGRVIVLPKEKKRIISPETTEAFRDILKAVVDEGGTGMRASIKGNDVAGKTGTAQLIDTKTKKYSKERFISSFVGFVPATNPRLSIIVVIYEPKGQVLGGVVAAPVFKNIADQALSYLNVPIEDSSPQNILLVSR